MKYDVSEIGETIYWAEKGNKAVNGLQINTLR